MKIYIRSNAAQEDDAIVICCEIAIGCFPSIPKTTQVAASSKLTDKDYWDVRYEDFLIRVHNVMRYCNYEVIRDYSHDSSDTDSESKYFAFSQDVKILGKDVKFIVFLRVSDHPIDNSAQKVTDRALYYQSQYKKYSPMIGRWRFKPILVDPSDKDSCKAAIHDLTTSVKQFTNESKAEITDILKSGGTP